MSNLRFYHPENLKIGTTVKLSDNAAAHATRVLRLELSDEIVLFNGDGNDYTCAITSIKKNEVLAIVKLFVNITNESPLSITLLQGISSGDRMDYTIQKAVELGVTAIVPIITTRSVVKLSNERAEKRLTHWQSIVHSACEQSGRALIPQVAAPITLALWLAQTPSPFKGEGGGEGKMSPTRITLDPQATKKLANLAKPSGEIQLLVGAEGGLSTNEIALASEHGFIGVQLGKRILRTETAPLATIAAMLTLWGDF